MNNAGYDCSVCCRPIRFHLRVSFSGDLAALDLYREDE
ncbi:MAG TPA: CPXCG motif-containing cysteine-rich protein [Gammaproteobacteria bacterium]